jgi:putative hydrolase of the HAD superfamily
METPRAVLFDIGGTLWSSPPEDPAALDYCYTRARAALLRVYPDAPPAATLAEAVEGYMAEWEEIWRLDPTQVVQGPTNQYVAEALTKLGLEPPRAVLAEFTDLLLETSIFTARTLAPEPGMTEALAALRERGLRLGCISNAFMTAAGLHQIMVELGLGKHLELTLSSCEFGYRKPHPSIYIAAAEGLGVSANETIFVGDRLEADVAGPASLGMRTVLTQQYRVEDPAIAQVQPDAVITHLRELVPFVDMLLSRMSSV